MKSIKDILFPQKVVPVRLEEFCLFNVGGRVRCFFGIKLHNFEKQSE